MFDILKKKIAGFVDKLSGKLEKEKPKEEPEEKSEKSEIQVFKPISKPQEQIFKPEPLPESEKVKPETSKSEPKIIGEFKSELIGESKSAEESKPELVEEPGLDSETKSEMKLEPIEEFQPESKPEPSVPESLHFESKPEIKEEPPKEPVKQPEVITEVKPEKESPEVKSPIEKLPEVKTSIFGKIKSLVISDHTIVGEDIDEALEELETQLITSDVALAVAEAVVSDMKTKMIGTKVKYSNMSKFVKETMLSSITEVMKQDKFDLIEFVKTRDKPVKILLVGPNGAGKTTTIAKLAHLLKKNGITSVMSASDTFRAAAIEQTEEHARRVGVPVIKHQYGSDPAAVTFDAVRYAESHKIDVVLMDTAGRQETNTNLVEELKKIVRISKPDLKIFIGEGIVGNAIINQVSSFHEAIGLDGVILSKIDVDTKGGTIISVRKATGIPIFYIAVGQSYEDLLEFDPKFVISKLFS